ncbi:MAG TPA: hypothetical protein VFS43_47390 [Polyangiaceae bacterium]|nr:hypothetical protein [Polyangiaceae bacterium]
MYLDRLRAELSIAAGEGAPVAVPSRHVERFDLRLDPWGFEAELAFWVVCEADPSEDTLFDAFVGPAQLEATLTLGRSFDEVGEDAEALVLKGLAVERSARELPAGDVAGAPVLSRRYRLRFVDRARALWPHHRPDSLYVDATYRDLFADNLPRGVSLAHAWAASSARRPVLSLGLGAADEAPAPGVAPASFYDFTFWLLDREAAGLFYDYASSSYRVADEKPNASSPRALEPDEVEAIEIALPRLRRAKVVVLNAYADAAEARREIANAVALEGVRADALARTPVASEFDARVKRETARARQPREGARVTLRRTPAAALAPNLALTLGEGFSDKLFAHGKTYRIVTLRLRGVPPAEAGPEAPGSDLAGQGAGADAPGGDIAGQGGGTEADLGRRYALDYELDLELASDPSFHAPPFAPPPWPFFVEGNVVSEIGQDDELTYQAYRDEATSLDFYKIAVPLFEGKKVIAPYEPTALSGQFYFPLYKGERVLVALDFDRASVAGHLDWRPGARLPLESQGNHLLLGKKGTSQTSLRHTYADGKPSLTIERTSDKDRQTIVISEGTIRLETKEDEG